MEETALHRLMKTLLLIGCEFEIDGNAIVIKSVRFEFDENGKFGRVV